MIYVRSSQTSNHLQLLPTNCTGNLEAGFPHLSSCAESDMPLFSVRIFTRQLVALLFGMLLALSVSARTSQGGDVVFVSELPVEARHTLQLIRQGGPFPYEKDGAVFGNYERLLPKQNRGYYREFTVKTPGVRNRGARRIITGGELNSPRELYYTEDHYASFRRIQE
ncbi:MAG TPA: ribonuclease [Noviherbaspirillum sp.]